MGRQDFHQRRASFLDHGQSDQGTNEDPTHCRPGRKIPSTLGRENQEWRRLLLSKRNGTHNQPSIRSILKEGMQWKKKKNPPSLVERVVLDRDDRSTVLFGCS